MKRPGLEMVLATALALAACSKAKEPVAVTPDGAKGAPAAASVVEQAVVLTLPSGVVAEVYAQVRGDARLGAALEGEMIPALEQAGAPAARIAAFVAAREAAVAGWTPTPVPGPASTATGPAPGVHPLRVSFDQVSTDVLRAWFVQVGEAVAAGEPKEQAIATLTDLEARARASFTWDTAAAESVAVRVMLVRRSLG